MVSNVTNKYKRNKPAVPLSKPFSHTYDLCTAADSKTLFKCHQRFVRDTAEAFKNSSDLAFCVFHFECVDEEFFPVPSFFRNEVRAQLDEIFPKESAACGVIGLGTDCYWEIKPAVIIDLVDDEKLAELEDLIESENWETSHYNVLFNLDSIERIKPGTNLDVFLSENMIRRYDAIAPSKDSSFARQREQVKTGKSQVPTLHDILADLTPQSLLISHNFNDEVLKPDFI